MKKFPLPEVVRQSLLTLTLISFAGVGGIMLLITLFVFGIGVWDSVDKLSYWNWVSAPAIVVRHEDSEQRGTYQTPRSITSCPVIRFRDRAGKSYEVKSTCAQIYASRQNPNPQPAYWRGKEITVWYDPSNPTRTLIAAQKPKSNPLRAVNMVFLLLGTLAFVLWLGAKTARRELQKSKRD